MAALRLALPLAQVAPPKAAPVARSGQDTVPTMPAAGAFSTHFPEVIININISGASEPAQVQKREIALSMTHIRKWRSEDAIVFNGFCACRCAR